MGWEGISGRGADLELGSLRKQDASASPGLSFCHRRGIRPACWGEIPVALPA